MPPVYNFEAKQPPPLDERALREQLRHRELQRQVLILRIAAILLCLCYILFAFCIAPESIGLAVLSMFMAYVSIVGEGVLAVLVYKKGACFR